MKEQPEFELLIEIAKLLNKYGTETFDSLANYLSLPESSERLVSILSQSARAYYIAENEKNQKVVGNLRPRNFRSSLIELEKTDPEKSALLVEFYDSLIANNLLPTMQSIRAFASDMGLQPIKATSRNKAIIPLVKALMPLPVKKFKKKLDAMKPVSTKNDRSLEGWASIILDKEQRTKREE